VSRVVRHQLTDTADRRLLGGVISALGVGFLALLWFLWTGDADPPLVRVAGLAGVGLLTVVAGLRIATGVRDTLLVDLDTRRVTSTRAKDGGWSASLDEVGPLTVLRGTRRLLSARGGERSEYLVVLAGRTDLLLYRGWDFAPMRRAAERLARRWTLGLRGLDGRIRSANGLDLPMWSLPDDGVGVAAPLPASAGVTVEVGPERAVMRSEAMSRLAVVPNYLLMLWAVMAGAAMYELPVQVDLEQYLAARVSWYLLGVVAVACASGFLWQLRQFLGPPVVTITLKRVSYRGRRLPLSAVREVVWAGAIAIAGARRSLVIEPEFCATSHQAVADEIRRLIVDYGRRPKP
jgi:hypothetical protein